jgi:hypothetical protein
LELFSCPSIEHLSKRELFMRVRTYRDQAYARHFDLIGTGVEPWTVDLVSVAAAMLLVSGFVCAIVEQLY